MEPTRFPPLASPLARYLSLLGLDILPFRRGEDTQRLRRMGRGT